MISSLQALELVLASTKDIGVVQVPLEKSLGRILRETIKADRDFPPFDRVSMDGIAINFQSRRQGSFEIEGMQAAGDAQKTLKIKSNCLEIMTGAVLPKNTDTVIPYEILERVGNVFTYQGSNELKKGANVHSKGKDEKRAAVLLKSGIKLSPAEIGVLASVGKSVVKVSRNPKALILSTGDELVDVNQKPTSYQIRKSNVHVLSAQLKQLGIKADMDHLNDNKTRIDKKLPKFLNAYDVILFSGAVSKGKFDFMPGALENAGVKKIFHQVKQRPGKPFWFGKSKTCTVFGFPGNPISSFVGFIKYAVPFILSCQGAEKQRVDYVALGKDFSFKPALTYFLQVCLDINSKGERIAIPEKGNGSGDLANLRRVDGFIELPANKIEFRKGEVFPYLSFRL